jgi:hypothetical protein
LYNALYLNCEKAHGKQLPSANERFNMPSKNTKQPYQPPQLELHLCYMQVTGVSLPVGSSLLPQNEEIFSQDEK